MIVYIYNMIDASELLFEKVKSQPAYGYMCFRQSTNASFLNKIK